MNHAMISSGGSASSILVEGSARFNLREKPNFLTNNRFYSNTHLPKSSLFIKTRPGSGSVRARPIKAAINDMYATVLPSRESFYNLLGVSESGCTFSDIKKAYKQLARKYHPDVSPPDRTEEYTRRFIEVREAYETLSDPTSRSLYDRDLAKGLHLAFSARKRSPYDQRQGFNERVKWRNWWEPQLTELLRRSVNKKDSRDNASWGARMRRQMKQTIN